MIVIRSITIEEALPIRHQVLWPEKAIDYVRVDNDTEGNHYGLYLDDVIVSVISVFVINGEAQYRKFATLVSHQGRGFGSLLFEYMLKALEEQGVHRIWCNARQGADKFYKRYGFKNASDQVFYKGGLAFTVMEKLY